VYLIEEQDSSKTVELSENTSKASSSVSRTLTVWSLHGFMSYKSLIIKVNWMLLIV